MHTEHSASLPYPGSRNKTYQNCWTNWENFKKMYFDPNFVIQNLIQMLFKFCYTKFNSKWVIDLNVKHTTKQLLIENLGKIIMVCV